MYEGFNGSSICFFFILCSGKKLCLFRNWHVLVYCSGTDTFWFTVCSGTDTFRSLSVLELTRFGSIVCSGTDTFRSLSVLELTRFGSLSVPELTRFVHCLFRNKQRFQSKLPVIKQTIIYWLSVPELKISNSLSVSEQAMRFLELTGFSN